MTHLPTMAPVTEQDWYAWPRDYDVPATALTDAYAGMTPPTWSWAARPARWRRGPHVHLPRPSPQYRSCSASVFIYGTGHGARRPPRLTANPGPGALDGLGAVQQRLAAQPVGDAPGFLHRGRRALGVTQPREVLGIVEQAMREVIGRAQLT